MTQPVDPNLAVVGEPEGDLLAIGDADRGWRVGAAKPQQESASAPDAHGSAVVDHGRETDPTRRALR